LNNAQDDETDSAVRRKARDVILTSSPV